MTTPSPIGRISPSTGNILVGKGILIFKEDGQSKYYALGNCPKMDITPKVTTLDHFDSQAGTKTKDLTVNTEKSMEAKITMEEFTARNLAILLLGDVDNTDPQKPIVNLFSAASKTGHLKFFAANEVGPRHYVDLPSVTFNPSGTWSPISDGFNSMEATATVNSVSGVWGTSQIQPAVGTIAPENVLEPFIDSIAAAVHSGNVLVAYKGAWIGADSFTYQWYKDSSPIYLAVDSTYTVVSGDTGHNIHVVVTGTNTIGSTNGTSDALAVT